MSQQKLMAKLLIIQSLLRDIDKNNLPKETKLIISAIEERVNWIIKNLLMRKARPYGKNL